MWHESNSCSTLTPADVADVGCVGCGVVYQLVLLVAGTFLLECNNVVIFKLGNAGKASSAVQIYNYNWAYVKHAFYAQEYVIKIPIHTIRNSTETAEFLSNWPIISIRTSSFEVWHENIVRIALNVELWRAGIEQLEVVDDDQRTRRAFDLVELLHELCFGLERWVLQNQLYFGLMLNT